MTYDKTTKNKILRYAAEYSGAAACKKFDISTQTLYAWKKQAEPDFVKPDRKQFFRKVDPEAVRVYLLENPDSTCWQVGMHFGVSDVAILKIAKKLGFSFKKRNYSILNETK